MPQPIDVGEIAELLDQHAARMEWYAAQWTTNPEDCVQEAFVELARQPKQPENVVAWLYRVVRNRAMNVARTERRRSHHELVAMSLGELATREPLSEADRLSLPEALAALSAAEREVVVLRIWSELTWREIAELVGTSGSSAQRTYVAALENLKQQLEPPCPVPIPCRQN